MTAIHDRGGELILDTRGGEFVARHVIPCAGLWADRVAALTDITASERIVPFRAITTP